MRIKTFTQGGYMDGGFTSGGGTMTGPLILSGTPTKELEAATKQYVDEKTATFDAVKFTSGTLQVGRLPALTGDVVSSTGSNVISLANSGVAAGVYTKVTVNAKGLITGGGGLSESDIPDLDWGKFTTGKPTTLAGYGITDAIAKSGSTVSGALTLHTDPTSTNHLATKQYVDNVAGNVSALKTGDIISKLNPNTPSGFLRCNGAKISKTTYSALYAVLGDNHTYALTQGQGEPWRNMANMQTAPAGDTAGSLWTRGGFAIPATLYKPVAFVTNNRIHIYTNYQSSTTSGGTAGHYMAYVGGGGNIGAAFERVSDNANVAYGARAIVTLNRVYIIGGYGGTSASPIATAVINADGTTGPFTIASYIGAGAPSLVDPAVFVTKGRVYVAGGLNMNNTYSPAATNKVYTAPINSDGTLGAWSESLALPTLLYDTHVVISKNRVYLLGGMTSSFGYVTTIYSAVINQDGTIGNWTSAGTLPWSDGQYAVVIGSRAGIHAWVGRGDYHFYAPWNPDGSIGSWTLSTGKAPVDGNGNKEQIAGPYIAVANRVYVITTANWSIGLNAGLDSYSAYYDGTITTADPNNFGVPDLTPSDLPGSYSYIKI